MFLRGEQVALPENLTLYSLLRDRRVVLADENGRSVRKISAAVGDWRVDYLAALLMPSSALFDGHELKGLRQDVTFAEIAEKHPKAASSEDRSTMTGDVHTMG